MLVSGSAAVASCTHVRPSCKHGAAPVGSAPRPLSAGREPGTAPPPADHLIRLYPTRFLNAVADAWWDTAWAERARRLGERSFELMSFLVDVMGYAPADWVGKPVIAYKLGRSLIGQELAKSHTGAIAGSDATFDAFCRRHGIARVSMFESLIDVPALLVGRPPSGTMSVPAAKRILPPLLAMRALALMASAPAAVAPRHNARLRSQPVVGGFTA